MMRKSYLAAAAAAGLLLALGASAQAAGKGLGGGGPSSTPPGFSSQGGHNGFEPFTNTTPPVSPSTTPTTTSTNLPGGWDEGNAGWKGNLQGSNPILTTRPPGLNGH
jgi:hypothetical protein